MINSENNYANYAKTLARISGQLAEKTISPRITTKRITPITAKPLAQISDQLASISGEDAWTLSSEYITNYFIILLKEKQ